MNSLSALSKILLAAVLSLGCVNIALADDDEGTSKWWKWGSNSHAEGGKGTNESSRGMARGGALASSPKYQQECASCHLAYPAALMPAGSWQHLMSNLSKHFGSDASLDASTTLEITNYLTSNAGTYKRVSEMPPQDRITETYWFQRKHNKHVNTTTWSRPAIGSPSNCAACHQGAAQGDFNEHSVRIPA